MKKTLLLLVALVLGVAGMASAQTMSPLGIWTNAEKKPRLKFTAAATTSAAKL
ncbi:hypothetical protein ACFQT0_16080 [Hymenobacter humi]|uniref:Uncharacterized protein n=1 Tax=Hymenobacter humi TaxID=1411620 RepID=A0ABW2U8B4_9BACT